nr:AMP-binding protein [bacterium]
GYLFLAAAFGIGIGSVLSGRMSGRNIEFGIVPLGALGFALSAISLSIFNDSILVVIITVVLLGISAGVFIIPLNAFIQFRSPAADRGKILAASGFAGWLGVLIAAALVYLLSGSIGISAAGGFFIIGCITSVLTLITMKVLPDFTIRFICISILRIFYRIRSIGLENIPIEGPAMLVSNHVSWVDALILNATQQRRIRFLMQRELYNVWYLNPLLKLMGVIPISSEDAPRAIAGAFSAARKALDDGYMVCIFAEGSITRSGMTGGFKAGMEKIVKGRDCPVIPVYLGGLWGSIFSYAHGPLLSALPVKIPYPVTVIFGKSMSADSTADMVRQAVMELSCKYFISKQEDQRALPVAFAASARKHWKNHAVSDTTGKELTYGELFVAATAVSKVIEIEIGDDEKIGVLLPPSVGGAVVNIALSLLGRTVVNLNYSASLESVESAIKQCSIRHIISSELFMEKVSTLASLPGVIFAEDLKARISGGLKIRSWVSARFLPLKLFFFRLTQGPDDIAAIIFSSGSTGDPKGVQLSGNNILSNVEAVKMVLRPRSEDNICSALPFFHSLGYMATIWLPLLSGCSAAYHNNPMEGAKIAELVRQRRSTMLLAAPTFLLVYLRRAQPEDFSSLRLVITGAEKLQERVADSFEKKFGIRPLEGYGVTEMSPVIALSLPDTEIDRVRQIGSKNGSVGHPIPGVAVRIVDPESGEILPSEAQGLILARGPNIMRSYLNRAELTAEVIKDGWYITGDIGFMDKDGFLFITDRLARFSKIGGEMVPHQGIEDEYNRHISTDTVSLAVTSVPDEKRGEKIVVLYTKNAGTKEALQKIIEASAIPNLWKPNKDCYIELNEIPLLGSGKRDLKKMRELARELA